MDIIMIFGVLSGIIFLGYISEYIFKKTNIPDVLFLIATGILIRYIFELVNPEALSFASEIFTTFALIFLLFQGSLNIDFKMLVKILPSTLKITLLHFFFTLIIVSAITYFLFDSLMLALLCGMVLSGTSSAVVIPLIRNISVKEKFGNILTLESAITDVLGIIGVLTLIEIIDKGNIIASEIFKNILSSFSMAIIVGVIIGFLWISILSKYEGLIDAHILTIGMVMGIYAFVESNFVEASGAIGALSFGLVLGNSRGILSTLNKKKDERIEKRAARLRNKDKKEEILDTRANKNVLSNSAKQFYSEISFFLKIFFFVYLGILIEFSEPIIFIWGLIVTLGIYLIRPVAVKIVFNNERNFEKDKLFVESMIPKGLAAAVLAQLAVQSNILGTHSATFVNIVLSVVIISIVFTSIFIFLAEKEMFKGFFNNILYPNKNSYK